MDQTTKSNSYHAHLLSSSATSPAKKAHNSHNKVYESQSNANAIQVNAYGTVSAEA